MLFTLDVKGKWKEVEMFLPRRTKSNYPERSVMDSVHRKRTVSHSVPSVRYLVICCI